jgi:hypothetical protein
MMLRYKLLSVAALLGVAAILGSAQMAQQNALPTIEVGLTKMNVLYNGVQNPVHIACRGMNPENLIVSLSNGTITPANGPGEYTIYVDKGTTTILNVQVKNGNSTPSLGSYQYRIKRVPDPFAYVNNIKHDGTMLKSDLQTISGVFARMENFDFDCSFRTQTFNMTVFSGGTWKEYKTVGPALSAEMKAALNDTQQEDKIIFHSVITKGPDSTLRKVNPVMITVK